MKTLASVELSITICGWVLFLLVFIARPRGARRPWVASDRRSVAGIVLQVAAVSIMRGGLRPAGAGLLPGGFDVELAVCALAVGLIVASLVLAASAVAALGTQWSLTARLVEGHELITSGPYAFVRHPIYTATLGLLVGSALCVSRWQDLIAAVVVFLIGTALRVHSEERLLTTEFGDEYRAYAGAVPALIPLTT